MSYHYSEPGPVDIHKALTKASAGERQTLIAGYLGREVCWKTIFFRLTPSEVHQGELSQLALTAWEFQQIYNIMIFARIEMRRYPELLDVHRGRKIVVTGTILEVEDFTINLQVTNIELLPEHFWDSWGNV